MNKKNAIKDIKKFWNWTWHSDSIASWFVALIFIFIIVKFIFFPTLSLIFGTSLPLAGIESSSMSHQSTKYCLSGSGLYCTEYSSRYQICGKYTTKKESFNFEEYWETCGEWYKENNISQDLFKSFSLKNGFNKGDIIIVWGRFTPEVGDIIIFKPNSESLAPRPIIHRIVKIENNLIQTKGDHNEDQLKITNNNLKTDETAITNEQIIGKAIFKIPYLGWIKIWAVQLLNLLGLSF